MSGVAVWLGVPLLGGAGAVARVALAATVDARRPRAMRLPLGTLTVNLTGALLLGLLAGLAPSDDLRLLAGTALLGGYTTFSTWMADSVRLERTGHLRTAAFNVAGSLVLGFAGVALGHALGTAL
ncbi:fluoride efflux transporter CrcB [Conexibacter sp. JD483]|uniref:fluoride efflux transporter CrcB n=1 Tax=unclassified Conexibacter TaxID=2627773 RepID=UPI00271B6A1E|nr:MULTISPECIES: fluoride efflux transporter CrcB [unclassified Conexibacter]MDO8189190.1 fluoride efflux transporter CrcB [Conexibacter sp. CPCC 205706]MDO8201923.1 fluoride efflux transporter CrcB [Conexibacter sp. CPCC 205762]MDR9371946.1 fluoride efflux transporter CrcB [Conexibacter sp. JD483]